MDVEAGSAGQTVWKLQRSEDLLWRDWEDSAAVYDARSGHTHLLNALGMELLAMLMTAPRSEATLLHELTADMPDGLDADEAMFHVGSQLRQLQELGLVEPVTMAR